MIFILQEQELLILTTTEGLFNFTGSNIDMFGGNVTADNFFGNLTWTDLDNYPVACPAGSAITQLNDSVTCTAFNQGTLNSTAWNRSGTNVILANTGDYVGIGTTNPEYELDVNGFINTKSIHEISSQGLVGAWALNEKNSLGSARSETILDSSTENNHGTNNGATFTTDKDGVLDGAMSFNGYTKYIDIENSINTDVSISFWVKRDNLKMII